jgi:CubicO group peptidase (beta-lactamase class C family)
MGTKALGAPDVITRDTIFRISSMTKPIIAAATMILVEECKLRLDDPVDELLPELSARRVLKRLDGPLGDTAPAHRPISVRDLLTFRMGFGQLMSPPDAYPILKAASELGIGMGPPNPSEQPEPNDWMRRLGTLPLMYQPGERWIYNTGSDVLGVLIARAAGQPLEAFLRDRIFGPLGMNDTAFGVPPRSIDRLASSYLTNSQTGALDLYDAAVGGQWSHPPAFPSGAAGLVSTVDDYHAFSQMLLNGGAFGGHRVLSRPTVEVMTADHLTAEQKSVSGLVSGYFHSHGWGFGVSVVTHRDNVAHPLGTFGWDGGLDTSWYADPGEQMTMILLTQASWTSPNPPPICRDFWTLAYQALDD